MPVPFTEALLSGVDRYANSRIEIAQWDRPGSRLASIRRALRFSDVRNELVRGVADVAELARCENAQIIHGQHLLSIPAAVAAGRAVDVATVATVRDY